MRTEMTVLCFDLGSDEMAVWCSQETMEKLS